MNLYEKMNTTELIAVYYYCLVFSAIGTGKWKVLYKKLTGYLNNISPEEQSKYVDRAFCICKNFGINSAFRD